MNRTCILAAVAAATLSASAAQAVTVEVASIQSAGTIGLNNASGNTAITLTDNGGLSYSYDSSSVSTIRDYSLTYSLTASTTAFGGYAISDSRTLDLPQDVSLAQLAGVLSTTPYLSFTANSVTLGNTASDWVLAMLVDDADQIPSNFSLGGSYAVTASLSYEDTSPIPLPAALPMLLAGLGGFAALRSRKTAA